MKKSIFSRINLAAVLAAFCLFSPAISYAEVNAGVTVALPPFVIPAPPALVVIPGSYVYYPPDVRVDIFIITISGTGRIEDSGSDQETITAHGMTLQ